MVVVALGAFALLAACGQGAQVAKVGDKVSVNYTGTLDDGTVFDSSKGRDPLKFTVGANDVIAGFDKAVTGLKVGESKKVRMEAKDAYGEPRPELIITVTPDKVPADVKVGQTLYSNGQGVIVTAVTPTGVTIDTNHPLAGKALTFDVQLVSIDK